MGPYAYVLRAAQTNAVCSVPWQEDEADARPEERHTHQPPSEKATACQIGATCAQATEASAAVVTGVEYQGISPATAAACHAEGQHMVLETGEASGDSPWIGESPW